METPLILKIPFNRIRKFLPVRKYKNILDDRIVISVIIHNNDFVKFLAFKLAIYADRVAAAHYKS